MTLRNMLKQLQDIRNNGSGEVRVGLTGTQATYVLPHFLPQFKKQYPNIDVILVEDSSTVIEEKLVSGEIDIGILGALEVDTDFNVNILTGSSGKMMGGLGGGPDVAGGAAVSIVTIPIIRGRTPSIVKKVFTACTPGETIAAVVTEAGIALNPRHRNYRELREDLKKTNLKLVSIEELQQLAESLTGVPKPIETSDRVACIVEYRDGTVIDVIRRIRQ